MSYKIKPQIKLYSYEAGVFKLQYQVDDYESCSWQRNKYQAGQFTISINLNIPNSRLFKKGMFVQFGNDPKDFGFIQDITSAVGEEGKGSQMLSVIGYDCRYLYRQRIIKQLNSVDTWSMTDSGEICMRKLISDQCGETCSEAKRKLNISNTIPSVGLGGEYTVSEAYSNLYETLVTIATQTECMWFVEFINGELVLNFYAGNDLSSTVRFDVDYDSIANGQYNDSFDSFTNAVYVGGQGSGEGREIYEGESGNEGASPSGFDRFESWDDCSMLTTEAEYENRAESILNEYAQTFTLSGAGLAKSPYVYKEQYDVGDIITVNFNGITTKVEIQNITEHWMKGSYNIEFEFGKPVKDLTRQLELLLSKIQNYQATGKASSTTEIKYYTIPTDTEMKADEVTYTRIGFKGTIGANGNTFKLYKNGATGVKSYHVYVNQLATSGGKLTLTTGTQGAENLVLDSGTYVVIIYVDENGNVRNQGMTPTSTISAGNIAPVESGAVAGALTNISGDISDVYNTLNNKIDGGNFLCNGAKKTYEFTKQISNFNTWVDLITSNDISQHKIFAFNITLDDRSIWWNENLSFVMFFYNYITNSTESSPIYFNQSGHAPNGATAQLRFLRTSASGEHYGKIQINLSNGRSVKAIVRAFALTDTIPEYHG